MLADIEEIAESIEDVRGIPRAMVARCSGTAAMGGGVVVTGRPVMFEEETGSDTLLEGALTGLDDGLGLEFVTVATSMFGTSSKS